MRNAVNLCLNAGIQVDVPLLCGEFLRHKALGQRAQFFLGMGLKKRAHQYFAENRVNLVLIVKALHSALLPQITLYRLAQTKQRPCTPVLLLE